MTVTAPSSLTAPARTADRLFVAALGSGAAGCAHLSVAGDHLAAWWGYGAFFLLVGSAQLVAGLALVRAARDRLVRANVWGNLVLILLYVASRTVGVPIGPEHAGHRLEPAGPLDLVTVATEVLIVFALLPVLPRRSRRVTMDLLLVCGLALWLLRATGRLG